MEAWELALALAGSFVAGYVGSMLGLVLGTLRLPLIVAISGNPLAAAGTNIAISAAAAASGAVSHARERRVDWRVVAWMAPPSIVGAVVGGTRRRRCLPRACSMSRSQPYSSGAASTWPCGPSARKTRERLRLWPAVAGGLGIGALGGAVGVILGTLRMPTLLRARRHGREAGRGNQPRRRLPPRPGGVRDSCRRSGVDWDILLAGLAGAIPGGWLGARATGRVDENVLRLVLGAVLVLVGAVFAAQAVV